MLKFCGMGNYGFIAVIFIFFFLANTCDASLAFHLRKLITNEPNNASTTSRVSPTGSPVNESNTNPINAAKSEEKQKESQMGNQDNRNNKTLPTVPEGPKKNGKDNKDSGAPSPPVGGKNGSRVGGGNDKAANATKPKLGSCVGSMTSCREQEMLACIEVSKLGSKEMFLVVQNEGESTLKVNINSPNYFQNDLRAFEVPKHQTRKMDISSIVGKSSKLTVNSGNVKCVLHLAHPVSVDKLIQQLSFYSKQVSPMYVAYGSFLLALLVGGTWACCKLRKRNQENGIPYQELEMGFPESASGANVDPTEGWDHDWDEDWDEENAVKSPGGHQVTSISADGLTSRSPKKDGWDNDWED